jgi:hypothetical protein
MVGDVEGIMGEMREMGFTHASRQRVINGRIIHGFICQIFARGSCEYIHQFLIRTMSP